MKRLILTLLFVLTCVGLYADDNWSTHLSNPWNPANPLSPMHDSPNRPFIEKTVTWKDMSTAERILFGGLLGICGGAILFIGSAVACQCIADYREKKRVIQGIRDRKITIDLRDRKQGD